jgi:pSer/pThr/pTyr-binding forkhead associated (FHA) protein
LGTARFNPKRMVLVLRVRDTGREYTFNGGDFKNIVLGRVDPETGKKPDVDLTQDDGVNKGVSRRHAVITRKDEGTLSIMDMGAANHTFLNGTRLIPNQPRMLRDSDELRLGKLVILVRYMQIPQHRNSP